jgi:hypothetical protein
MHRHILMELIPMVMPVLFFLHDIYVGKIEFTILVLMGSTLNLIRIFGTIPFPISGL